MFTGKHFREACQRAYPPIPYRNVKHQHAANRKDCNVFAFIHKNVLLINHPLAVAKTEATLPYANARRDFASCEIFNTNQTPRILFPLCISNRAPLPQNERSPAMLGGSSPASLSVCSGGTASVAGAPAALVLLGAPGRSVT